jgi:virulence-associated protein VapD
MRYWIKPETEADNKLIQSFLLRNGFTWSSGETYISLNNMYHAMSVFRVQKSGRMVYSEVEYIKNTGSNYKIVNIPEFIDIYQKLRDKYNNDRPRFLQEME